jgi:hypothetical protein
MLLPASARETVDADTPASRARSDMLVTPSLGFLAMPSPDRDYAEEREKRTPRLKMRAPAG